MSKPGEGVGVGVIFVALQLSIGLTVLTAALAELNDFVPEVAQRLTLLLSIPIN